MKIYCYKELRQKNVDELLDLLSTYTELETDIYNIIKLDPEGEKFYIKELLYFYELNKLKIRNELISKSEN